MQQASSIIGFEEVDQFLKKSMSLERKDRHDNDTLVGCVYAACELYIWKKRNGYYKLLIR